jgi:hypothetical protein
MSLLNCADQALLVDILISVSESSDSITTKQTYLELIIKIKGLEVDTSDTGLSMSDIFADMDKMNLS